MEAYVQTFDLWEVTEFGIDPKPFVANPTVAQLKQHNEEVTEKYKAL